MIECFQVAKERVESKAEGKVLRKTLGSKRENGYRVAKEGQRAGELQERHQQRKQGALL